MWLHALQSMYEDCSSIHIVVLLLGLHGSGYGRPRPKLMPHGSPRVVWVCAEEARAIFACHKARSGFLDSQIADVVLISGRLDGVSSAIFAEGYGYIIGIETSPGLVETVVAQRVRAPLMLAWAIMVVDLAVELTGRSHTPKHVSMN